jgi:hypothetical protein
MNKRGGMSELTYESGDIAQLIFWLIVFGAVAFAILK